MDRRTRSIMPLSEELLRPDIEDPPTVSSEINRRKIASKARCDKRTQAPLMTLPLGSRVYATPRPSQRGSPWIYGQIIDSTTPRPYSIDTGNHLLPSNRAQLRPADPPERIPKQPPHQLSVPATPEHKPAQQPPAVSLQAERPSTPPPTKPQQQGKKISETSAVPTNQQVTSSGRVVRLPQKYKDFVLS